VLTKNGDLTQGGWQLLAYDLVDWLMIYIVTLLILYIVCMYENTWKHIHAYDNTRKHIRE